MVCVFNFYILQSTCAFNDGFQVFLPALKGIVPLGLDLTLNLALSSQEVATSLAVGKANGFSSAFIGTSIGRVLKVWVQLCIFIRLFVPSEFAGKKFSNGVDCSRAPEVV